MWDRVVDSHRVGHKRYGTGLLIVTGWVTSGMGQGC